MMPAAAMRLRTLDAAIYSMFAANEPGVWFDNSDLATLFEDSTGYFPASVNGLVGLQLDKRLGLDRTRRNLLSYSQDFNSTGWLKLGAGAAGMVVTDNAALAPDGTMTAASIVEGTGTVQHYIACYGEANSYPVYSGQAYTFSVSVKANGRNFVFLRGHNNTSAIFGAGIIVDLTTGAVHHPAAPAAGGDATVVVIDEGDGWWRIEMTSTAISDNLAGSGGSMIAPAASSAFNNANGTQQQSYTGDGVSGLLVWGAQVDRGAAATEYQPVTVSRGGWVAGNHRYQTTTAAKAILRGSPIGANLQTVAGWNAGAGWSIAGNTATATASTAAIVSTNVSPVVGRVYRFRYTITRTAGSLTISCGSALGTARSASGTYEEYLTALSTTKPAFNGGGGGFTGTVTLDSVEVVDVSADAVQAPYSLRYDGIDDFLQTLAIDFTGTDKMTVWSGVRKLSDGGTGTVVELSARFDINNGSFAVFAPPAAANLQATFFSRGTATGSDNTLLGASPVSAVLTGIGNIAGDHAEILVNGAADPPVLTDQGTGNYGNHALYMGRRGGTTLPFNGHEHQLIVLGAQSTAHQVADGNALTALRTGVTLP